MRLPLAALIALAISACSAPTAPVSTTAPAPTIVSGSPSTTPTVAATTASPALRPSSTPITELGQILRPLTNGWRPSGPTLMVVTSDASSSTLVALPLGANGLTSPATPIVQFNGLWDLRVDGTALAVAVGTGRGTRIATFELASNKSTWVTAEDPSGSVSMPVWSKDGDTIYYGNPGTAPPDFNGKVFRIPRGAGGPSEVATLARFGGLDGITPDGAGLVWSRIQAGGSLEILDVATGTNKHFDDVARLASVRSRQPRLLVMTGGCCAGRPGGSLVLWNDVAMTSRPLAERRGGIAWGTAAWDPSGSRIVAVRFDDANPYQGVVVALDPESGAARPIDGTLGARPLTWLDEGIVLARQNGATTELLLLPSLGGPPVSLFTGPNIYRGVMVHL